MNNAMKELYILYFTLHTICKYCFIPIAYYTYVLGHFSPHWLNLHKIGPNNKLLNNIIFMFTQNDMNGGINV